MIKGLPKILFMVIFTLGCFTQSAFGQEFADPLRPAQEGKPFYVGPVFGYNRVMHNTNKPAIPLALDEVPCPSFENGSANGFFAGVSVEFMIGKAANSKSSIIGRLLYNTFPSYFEQQGDDLPTTVNIAQSDGSVVPTETITSINYLNDITYSTVSLDALYKFNFINSGKVGIGIVAGPTFDFTMQATEINRLKLVSPDNALLIQNPALVQERGWSYPDGKTLQFNDGDITNAAGFRMGLKIGGQVEFNFKKFVVIPNIMYNLAITELSPDYDWRVNALQIGVDVRFAIK